MRNITYAELQQMQKDNPSLVLIDVREPYEHEEDNIGGKLIPMSELGARVNEIPKEGDVVLYCRTGSRSSYAVQALSQNGWNNLINLQGGIMMARMSG